MFSGQIMINFGALHNMKKKIILATIWSMIMSTLSYKHYFTTLFTQRWWTLWRSCSALEQSKDEMPTVLRPRWYLVSCQKLHQGQNKSTFGHLWFLRWEQIFVAVYWVAVTDPGDRSLRKIWSMGWGAPRKPPDLSPESRVGIAAVAVAVSPDIVTENILVDKILLPRTSSATSVFVSKEILSNRVLWTSIYVLGNKWIQLVAVKVLGNNLLVVEKVLGNKILLLSIS